MKKLPLSKGYYHLYLEALDEEYKENKFLCLHLNICYEDKLEETININFIMHHGKTFFLLRTRRNIEQYTITVSYKNKELKETFDIKLEKSLGAVFHRYKYPGIKNNAVRGPSQRSWLSVIYDHMKSKHKNPEYALWIENNEPKEEDIIKQAKNDLSETNYHPLISILMPTYNIDQKILSETLDSVLDQVYDNWELCIADDASSNEQTINCLKKYAQKDARIKVTFREENGHISASSNTALEMATGQYVTFLDHDDLLRPHSLVEFIKKLNENRNLEFIFSDEDIMDSKGERISPQFKLGYNVEMMRKSNYICHMTLIKKQILDKIGGFRLGFEGAQDYDLFLRALNCTNKESITHIPKILYHWRAVEGSTASGGGAKPYAHEAGRKALNEAMQILHPGVKVCGSDHFMFRYKVEYPLYKKPKVSIIIPTKDALGLLSTCISSIINNTQYNNYEIIVINNNSEKEETLTFLQKLDNMYEDIKVLDYNEAFNFAQIMNFGVAHASGEYVLLLNNDTEVINNNWLCQMVAIALQEDVGCVGAKLLFPDNSIQHAGIFLAPEYAALHSFLRTSDNILINNQIYLEWHQDVSAVTAACLLVKKSIYEQVGGMDAQNFKVAYNDVDFCLKVMDSGYRNVWTPAAVLYHYESASRGKEDLDEKRWQEFLGERNKLIVKWEKYINNDPCYSPNLTKTRVDFSLNI